MMLSFDAIRNNLRVYIVGEKDEWIKHYELDELGDDGYPDDCPCYIVNDADTDHVFVDKADQFFTIAYCYDGCTQYDDELGEDENGLEKVFTRQEVLDFFNKKDIEKIKN